MRLKIKNLFFFAYVIFFLSPNSCFAQDALSKAEGLFLQKKYWQAIEEANEVIKNNPGDKDVLAHADYLAGTSYVHLFDFLTAKKSFAAIVEKYKESRYYEDAYLALGDVALLQENLQEALKIYTEFYLTNPSKKRLATLYFRLAEVNLKLGNQEESAKYLKKLKDEFPGSFEARDSKRLSAHDVYYTCQVGAFTNYENAEKFIAKLKAQGYEVYSVLCMLSDKKLCRVRIGKFKTRAEAESLKAKLEKDGYFVKII